MARGGWRVTVRHGSKVSKLRAESADEALGSVRETIDRVRREGNLPSISAFREYRPGQRVHCRIEVNGPGVLRPPSGGVDVMGDGSVVAYAGAVRKDVIPADTVDEALDGLRDALAPDTLRP